MDDVAATNASDLPLQSEGETDILSPATNAVDVFTQSEGETVILSPATNAVHVPLRNRDDTFLLSPATTAAHVTSKSDGETDILSRYDRVCGGMSELQRRNDASRIVAVEAMQDKGCGKGFRRKQKQAARIDRPGRPVVEWDILHEFVQAKPPDLAQMVLLQDSASIFR